MPSLLVVVIIGIILIIVFEHFYQYQIKDEIEYLELPQEDNLDNN